MFIKGGKFMSSILSFLMVVVLAVMLIKITEMVVGLEKAKIKGKDDEEKPKTDIIGKLSKKD